MSAGDAPAAAAETKESDEPEDEPSKPDAPDAPSEHPILSAVAGPFRSIDALRKQAPIALRPKLWMEPHAESFWELFYDLIIVVAFIRLSSVKYMLTPAGIATTAVQFMNFWSCWVIMNYYVTSFAQNDILHRLFYTANLAACFAMVMFVGHADYEVFKFHVQARDFSLASIVPRAVSVFMWAHVYWKLPHGLTASARLQLRRATLVKLLGLCCAIACFLMVVSWEPRWDPKGDSDRKACNRRRLSEDHDDHLPGDREADPAFDFGQGSGYACGNEIKPKHYKTIIVWGAAVLVEQLCFIYATVWMRRAEVPFQYAYAADRMQAWIMLCFGESIIGLLNDETRLEDYQIKFKCLMFFIVLLMCSCYFDVMQGGRALESYIQRGGDNLRTRCYVALTLLFQGPFSFSIFMLGVGFKAMSHFIFEFITFVEETGCGKDMKENDLWRRLSAADVDHDVINIEEANDDYDDYIWLMITMLNVVYGSCILIAYTMPSFANPVRKHFGRIGGLGMMLMTVFVGTHRENIGGHINVDDDECSQYYEGFVEYFSHHGTHRNADGKGYTITEALYLIFIFALTALVLAHLSIDFDTQILHHESGDSEDRSDRTSGRKFSIPHLARDPSLKKPRSKEKPWPFDKPWNSLR
mmetsp:Transcript_888/g.2611  ORF Transcript_888/g.2611 Transcript_888/m.2611 type:complete len:640 (+) Transcript_888:187-2106(+)